MKTDLATPSESGGNRDGARGTTCHAFSLVIEPLDERAGIRVGARRVEDHLIGVIARATPVHETGSAKDACWITRQEMIFIRIIDLLNRGSSFDGDGLGVKAIDVVRSGLLGDRHHHRGC